MTDTAMQARLPSDARQPARLVLCERTGQWAVVLRAELAQSVALSETRSLAECWAALAQSRASMLVVEAKRANLDALLERMARFEREYSLARVAVVADRDLHEAEWLLREAGAVYFTTSPRSLGLLAGLIGRHLAEAPAPRLPLAERIWASLPWKSER